MTMTFCLYTGLGVLLLWVGLMVLGRVVNQIIGRRTTVGDFGCLMQWPMSRGLDGSRVWLRRPGTQYRLDFEKYIPPVPGKTRWEMVLESRHCSRSEFRAAQEALERRHIDFDLQHDLIAGTNRLVVQCGPDTIQATLAARAVLTEGFGLKLHDEIRACYSGHFDLDMSREPMAGWLKQEFDSDSNRKQDPR